MTALGEQQREQIVTAVIQAGLDDWVSLGDLDAIAPFYGVPTPARRSTIVSISDESMADIVCALVGRGLMRIGDVYTHGHFVPFEGDEDAAIAWMLAIFREADGGWPFAAWLDLTPIGTELAESLPPAAYHLPDGEGPR